MINHSIVYETSHLIAAQNSGTEVGSEVLILFEVEHSISHFLTMFSVS